MMHEPAGNRLMVERLLAAHAADVWAYARHLMRSEAEADDLRQEVMLEALRRPELLAAGNDPGAYLRGMARHLSSRVGRLRPMHASLAEWHEWAWSHSAQESPDPQEHLAVLRACLDKLAPRARALIDDRYHGERSAADMAVRHGMGVDAVRAALLRARQFLAECLKSSSGAVS